MQTGRKGMGIQKHRKSGVAPKSPKTRMRMKLEAERTKPDNTLKVDMYGDIKKLFEKKKFLGGRIKCLML